MSHIYNPRIFVSRLSSLSSTRLFAQTLEIQAEKGLALKSTSYQIIDVVLFRRKKNYDGVLLRGLEREDVAKVVKELHDGPVGGHFLGDTTNPKILRSGHYFPALFKDAHAYVRKCDTC